jgi:ketosteroid isomerase-like protein
MLTKSTIPVFNQVLPINEFELNCQAFITVKRRSTKSNMSNKMIPTICTLFAFTFLACSIHAEDFNAKQFIQDYFDAWTATQAPEATNNDIEHYLSFYKEDLGHQHLPYSPDDKRYPDGKALMREGMTHYLGGHSEYHAKLLNSTFLGDQVIVAEYQTHSKGQRPNGEMVEQNYKTMEVLELEDHKIAVIRKYTINN